MRVAPSPPNYYQATTSPGKLRGQYYTPDDLVRLMLDRLQLSPRDLVIDPACGDGSFLRGAVAAVARRFPGWESRACADHWSPRLVGFDTDADAVARARAGLRDAFYRHLGVDVPEASLRIYQADVLQQPRLEGLLQSVGAHSLVPKAFGMGERLLVVGNPPYVEAKRLPAQVKAALKSLYPNAVVGAPDLYLYFLHVCLEWLRDADALAFVLPNKLLVNANAQAARERLLDEGRLRGLWFATRAGIFPHAAVYPVVLFAGGPGDRSGRLVETVRLARGADGMLSPEETVTIEATWYRETGARALFPPPGTQALRSALQHLLEQSRTLSGRCLADVLDIRWTVSFHRAGLRERYVLPCRPDDPCARPFMGGGPFSGNGEVTRYRLEWAGWWIRYDQRELQAQNNPLPDPNLFEPPKIVICQNGRTLRAAYDEQGYVLKDTFLCGTIHPCGPVRGAHVHPLCRHPRALVGLLCSRASHFFYSHVFYGGHVSGGYLHFLRSFLVDLPLGTWTEAAAQEVADLVRQRETATEPAQQEGLEERIEGRVSEALRLTEEARAAIAGWAARDANWQARERVRGPDAVHGRRM